MREQGLGNLSKATPVSANVMSAAQTHWQGGKRPRMIPVNAGNRQFDMGTSGIL